MKSFNAAAIDRIVDAASKAAISSLPTDLLVILQRKKLEGFEFEDSLKMNIQNAVDDYHHVGSKSNFSNLSVKT